MKRSKTDLARKAIAQVLACTIAFMTMATSAYGAGEAEIQKLLEQVLKAKLEEQVNQALQAQANTVDQSLPCRNSQITSYEPQAGSRLDSLDEIVFYTTDDLFVPSLALSINGDSYPVEYVEQEDGTYRAKSVLRTPREGRLYVTMGAGSKSAGSCNQDLETAFTVGTVVEAAPKVSYTPKTMASKPQTTIVSSNTSVESEAPKTDSVILNTIEENSMAQKEEEEEEEASTSRSIFSLFTNNDEEEVKDEAEAMEEEAKEEESMEKEEEEEVVSDNEDEEVSTSSLLAEVTETLEETTEETEGSWDEAAQAAALVGSVSAGSGKTCNTLGSSWAWYVWALVLWVFVVVLWVVITYFVEEASDHNQYRSRLFWSTVSGMILMGGVWYVANPCATHLWVPVATVMLGALMYWLYGESEEDIHMPVSRTITP